VPKQYCGLGPPGTYSNRFNAHRTGRINLANLKGSDPENCAASNPTPYEEFRPASASYYTSVVLKATWPAFIGLACYLAFLIAFLLWRAIRLCCLCARRHALAPRLSKRASSGQEGGSGAGPPAPPPASRRVPLRAVSGLRIAATVFLAGVAVGCVYGMVKVNADLVDQGVATVSGVTSFIGRVLGAASSSVVAGTAIDGVLARVQVILDTDVNATGG
jgi:hypothetical protein